MKYATLPEEVVDTEALLMDHVLHPHWEEYGRYSREWFQSLDTVDQRR